jgi:hypothetical protein
VLYEIVNPVPGSGFLTLAEVKNLTVKSVPSPIFTGIVMETVCPLIDTAEAGELLVSSKLLTPVTIILDGSIEDGRIVPAGKVISITSPAFSDWSFATKIQRYSAASIEPSISY